MRVRVINMRDATARRTRAREQLERAGIAFGFFAGISGAAALEAGEFAGIDAAEFLLDTGRHPTPGEIGCFASHRRLWRFAAECGQPLLVMEDDFELDDNFAEALAAAEDVIDTAGFIRLQTDRCARKTAVADVRGFTLSRFTKPPHCLMCYCISAQVAARFVGATRILDAPVDVFIKKYWQHGQPLHALTPYSVAPSALSADTTIAGRVRRGKPLSVAIRRFLRKFGWQLERLRFNWRAAVSPGNAFAIPGNAFAIPGDETGRARLSGE